MDSKSDSKNEQPTESPEDSLVLKRQSRRLFVAKAATYVGVIGSLLALRRNEFHDQLVQVEKQYFEANGFPAAEPTTIPDRPFIHKRFREMEKDAGLDGVKLCISKISKEMSMSLGSLPWITSIGNKVVISQAALDLLNDREVVAVLGHELGHLKHGGHQAAMLLLPEEISLGVAVAAGTGMLLAARKARQDATGSDGEKPRVSRRNLFKAGATAVVSGGVMEVGVTSTGFRGAIQRQNEYRADKESVILSGDKDALISAFLKFYQEDLDRGFIYDGSLSHPTFPQRIERLNSR